MLPLIGLATSFLPELIRLIAGDKAGKIAGTVAQAVTDLTGTADPVAARRKLDADPAAAAALQQRLAEIALDATKAELAEAAQQRQDELTSIELTDRNTAGARSTMQALASASSPIAWGAPLVSVVVTVGFFIVLTMLMRSGLRSTDDKTVDIINIAVGVLGTGFATVVNFWLGSSSSSRNKEAQVVAMQADHSAQTAAMLDALQKAHDTHAQNTQVALAAVRTVASTAIENGGTGNSKVSSPPDAGTAVPAQDGFDRCVAVTLAQEGGFAELPNDPGGATNFGITLATLQAWRGQPVTADDVRDMPRQEAMEIYRSSYWLPSRCGDLPAGIDLMVFDCAVNSGPRTAVKLLQKAIGVTDDGSMGPRTLAAVRSVDDVKTFIGQLSAARLAYCRSLPTFADFGVGWSARIKQVTAAALAMT